MRARKDRNRTSLILSDPPNRETKDEIYLCLYLRRRYDGGVMDGVERTEKSVDNLKIRAFRFLFGNYVRF